MSMDIRKIKKLIEMLQESDLTEIEVTEGEEAVRISRRSSNDIMVERPTSERCFSVSRSRCTGNFKKRSGSG